jgi:hypothetical protein
VSEFLPHVSIILYRVYPDSHHFLRKLFKAAMITTLTGTTAETVLTMYLFGSLWNRWTLVFKVATPMLHLLFTSCQLWGSFNFYKMYKRQQRLIAKEEGKADDTEQQTARIEVEEVGSTISGSPLAVAYSYTGSKDLSRDPHVMYSGFPFSAEESTSPSTKQF